MLPHDPNETRTDIEIPAQRAGRATCSPRLYEMYEAYAGA